MERTTQVIGESGTFMAALERASRAAALDRPVLVIGERGTGKELVAERLHRLSPRWDQPLVIMNCAALPETLIEAELFGHEAGAFTGATKARTGRFEEADGGTLFLDELGTLSMAAQDRLLRAVEYGEITRIGSSRPMRVDVRIVAATNEHLPDKVDRHEFRADLLDRLSFEVVTLPPLRARAGDVVVLAEHFGRRMASELGRERWEGFGPAAMDALVAYRWPGNVRELENLMRRLAVLARDEVIGADAIRAMIGTQAIIGEPVDIEIGHAVRAMIERIARDNPAALDDGTLYDRVIGEVERPLIEAMLARHGQNQLRAARAMGINRNTLRKRLDTLGIDIGHGGSETQRPEETERR